MKPKIVAVFIRTAVCLGMLSWIGITNVARAESNRAPAHPHINPPMRSPTLPSPPRPHLAEPLSSEKIIKPNDTMGSNAPSGSSPTHRKGDEGYMERRPGGCPEGPPCTSKP